MKAAPKFVSRAAPKLLFLFLVTTTGPLTALPAQDWPALADELGLDHLLVESGTGQHGSYTLLGVAGHGYSSTSAQYRILAALQNALLLDASERQAIIFYEAYSPDLRKATPAQNMGDNFPDWIRRPWQFSSYLRQLCHVPIDYERDRAEISYLRRRSLECNLRYLAEVAAGHTFAYDVFLIWGVKPHDVDVSSPLTLIALAFTLILLTLPLLAVYLAALRLLRGELRGEKNAMGQRLFKVLLPLMIGVGSGIFWLGFRGFGLHLPGPLDFVVNWLIISSFYFALTFVACMWIADRLIFPENGYLPMWLIAVGYLISPELIVFGGAIASGAAGGGSSSRRDSSASSSSGNAGGALRSGGGSFGGGGASGSF